MQASTRIVTSCEEDDTSNVESDQSSDSSEGPATTQTELHDLLYDAQSDQRDQQYMNETYLVNSHSDAKLCCPCCFVILCVDCQKHETYQNLYRAMFVTPNIRVDWEARLRYDGTRNCLLPLSKHTPRTDDYDDYVTVQCKQCHTTVAALNTKQEMYYFSGCVDSS